MGRYSNGRSYSWLSVIVGLISMAVGLWCICTPGSTFAALIIVFIIGFFCAGVFDICFALSSVGTSGWGWRLATGIIDILLGIWLWAVPAAMAGTVLVYVVGFYIFFYSVMGIGESSHLGTLGVSGWGWMLFFCIVGVITSFLFLLSPLIFGGIFLSWLVGLSFVSYGIFRLMLPGA